MSDDLVNRLEDWRTVHPQDMDKPEGHLYEEAAACIKELEAALDKMKREARNEALREAADIAERWGDPDIQTEILALMEDKK